MSTVEAIQRELLHDGFVLRYRTEETAWTASLRGGRLPPLQLLARGRAGDARPARRGSRVFERLLTLRNDVGLLSEEYDPRARRQVGNFPQAFSHIALVDTASNLRRLPSAPGEHRGDGRGRGSSH